MSNCVQSMKTEDRQMSLGEQSMQTEGRQMSLVASDSPMSETHKDTLRVKLVKLTDSLILDSVVNELISKRVLNCDQRHQIRRNDATNREKVERFVDILVMRSDSAYYDFITSLRNTGQHHVANELEAEDSLR